METASYKLEPQKLNHLARESLMKAISSQMELIQRDIAWKAKYGLDNAEFARISAISGPMSETIGYLDKASNLLKETEILFREHTKRMQAMIDLAHKIKGSEEP